jgi:hypothetical protein
MPIFYLFCINNGRVGKIFRVPRAVGNVVLRVHHFLVEFFNVVFGARVR